MRSEVSKNYWQSVRTSQEEENIDDFDEDGRIIELDRDGFANHGDKEEVVDLYQNYEVSKQTVASTSTSARHC